jgi:hypothetical protein
MTRFDDNLWREVERRYGSELSQAEGPLSPGPRWRLPMIAGASLGVAGAGAAAVFVFGAASSPPAFAVTTHPDGTVSLVIRRLDGISGANRRLAQLGIHVRAVQVDAQCQASVSPALQRVTVATLQDRRAGWVGGVAGGVKARIRPAQIAGDRTLVIAAVPSKGQVRLVRGRAVRGAIPGCLPPVALLRSITPGGNTRILSCGAGRVLSKPPVVVSPAPNTKATNETTSTGSATNAPSSTTVSAPPVTTATSTNTVSTPPVTTAASTTASSGPTSNWQSTTSPAPQGVKAPPIIEACIQAARRAEHVQDAARGSARSRR